jgi:hypothetical protein
MATKIFDENHEEFMYNKDKVQKLQKIYQETEKLIIEKYQSSDNTVFEKKVFL